MWSHLQLNYVYTNVKMSNITLDTPKHSNKISQMRFFSLQRKTLQLLFSRAWYYRSILAQEIIFFADFFAACQILDEKYWITKSIPQHLGLAKLNHEACVVTRQVLAKNIVNFHVSMSNNVCTELFIWARLNCFELELFSLFDYVMRVLHTTEAQFLTIKETFHWTSNIFVSYHGTF